MLKFQPQPVPQLRPAVPLPLALTELMLNVWPVRLESPHWPCVIRVPVPAPDELIETSASMSAIPHPVVPWSAISQFPARSDLTILPVLAEPSELIAIMMISASTIGTALRAH